MQITKSDIFELWSANILRKQGIQNKQQLSLRADKGELLQSLVVLHQMLQNLFPEASMENSPWWGWEESLIIFSVWDMQHLGAMSWMEGKSQWSSPLSSPLSSHSSSHKAPTHCPNCLIRPLCCLLSDLFGRKVALNTSFRCAPSSTVACTFCACAKCNKRVALVLKTLD